MASAKTQTITLIINTPFNTPKGEKIFLTGNFPGCKWEPDCVLLKELSENRYTVTLPYKGAFKIKVTRGSYEKEAADSRGRILQDFTVDIVPQSVGDEDEGNQYINGESEAHPNLRIYDIRNWVDLGPLKAVGTIERIKGFYSPQLGNTRELHIRLPDDYYKSNRRYPVLYMHDGQNCFDPMTATFGTDWSVDDVLSDMVRRGEVRDAIVVGIYHKDRWREFNDEDQAPLYGDFLVDTLKPFIDSKYRTLKDRDNTFVMGSSFGSAISVSLSWRYPHVFGRAAGLAFNASFFEDALFRMVDSLPLTTTKLYLDHGTRGGDQKYGPHAKRFFEKLNKLGMPKDQYDYRVFEHTSHTEADWARRVHIPLKFLLGN